MTGTGWRTYLSTLYDDTKLRTICSRVITIAQQTQHSTTAYSSCLGGRGYGVFGRVVCKNRIVFLICFLFKMDHEIE